LKIRFCQLNDAQCRSDADAQLLRARQILAAQGRSLMGALLFSSSGTGSLGAQQDEAGQTAHTSSFSAVFSGVPMVGFSAGGQIGPQAVLHAPEQVASPVDTALLQHFAYVCLLTPCLLRTLLGMCLEV
jgi:small ligand-binding sensory domain FIST